MAFVLAALVTTIVSSVIMLFLGAYLLTWAVKIMKGADTSWKTAFNVNLIVVAIGFVLSLLGAFGIAIPLSGFLGLIVGIWLVKTKYNYDWKTGILTWLVWAVLSIIVGILLTIVLGLLLTPLLLLF
ncbi:MAG: hypothetical protein ABIG89_05390 [Candidatus Woesearchaeota archaeon]